MCGDFHEEVHAEFAEINWWEHLGVELMAKHVLWRIIIILTVVVSLFANNFGDEVDDNNDDEPYRTYDDYKKREPSPSESLWRLGCLYVKQANK